MAEMIDVGHKLREMDIPTVAQEAPRESQIEYPYLRLEKNAPDSLMEKEIGHECRLEIVGKITEKSINDTGKETHKCICIEVHKIGYVAKAGKASKEEYLKKSSEEREKYDKEEIGVEGEE